MSDAEAQNVEVVSLVGPVLKAQLDAPVAKEREPEPRSQPKGQQKGGGIEQAGTPAKGGLHRGGRERAAGGHRS